MAASQPLTDIDRWDWLIRLRDAALSTLYRTNTDTDAAAADAATPPPPPAVLLTCSALRARYRDVLRSATYTHPDLRIHIVYLRASAEALEARVRRRQGHYMKSDMVRSQLAALEEPAEDERDVWVVESDDGVEGRDRLRAAVLARVRAVLLEAGEPR
jgi:gluconokinase